MVVPCALRAPAPVSLVVRMSTELSELLADFAGALTSATFAPDEYPTFGYVNYEYMFSPPPHLDSATRPSPRSRPCRDTLTN